MNESFSTFALVIGLVVGAILGWSFGFFLGFLTGVEREEEEHLTAASEERGPQLQRVPPL